MASAIELYFDKAAESKIRAVWSELAAASLPARPLRIGARPHVSILILDSGSRASIEELFRSLVLVAPFPLTFTSADYFDGSDAVIFFKPAVPEALRRLHDVAVKKAQARSLSPRHFGDEWIPHCTCDYGVDANQIAAGLAILNRYVPFEASVEEIGCVEVTPTSVTQIANIEKMSDIPELAARYVAALDVEDDDAFHRLIELGAEAAATLVAAFHNQKRATARARLVQILAEFRDSANVPFLESVFDDSSPEVWKAGIDALVSLGGPDARAALFRMREKESVRLSRSARLDWINEALQQTQNAE